MKLKTEKLFTIESFLRFCKQHDILLVDGEKTKDIELPLISESLFDLLEQEESN